MLQTRVELRLLDGERLDVDGAGRWSVVDDAGDVIAGPDSLRRVAVRMGVRVEPADFFGEDPDKAD